MTYNRMDQ